MRTTGWKVWQAVPLCTAAILAWGATAGAADAPQSKLEAQIRAGEFGPALDAANSIDDLTQRVKALGQVAAAQRDAGDFRGAENAAARMPASRERSRTRGETARQRDLSGGSTQADFTELMDLIKSTVDPESWDDVGGPGSMRQFNTGVYVDPRGVMRQLTKEEKSGSLESLARRAREAELNDDLARPSDLRLVSLKRLEKAVAKRIADGKPIPETLRVLCGLTQIRYVFVYPEEQEIVIAGPSEAWRYDENGRPVGRETGRPLMQLDDLVVVLRSFAPGAESIFGCSINTRDANLKAVKEFVEASNNAGALRPGALGKWLKELHSRLGMQDVVVHGVPADTRVAQVLVEADYRMKLIGVAKLEGGPKVPSYFDLLRRAGETKGAPMEALRWWMTMKYGAILHSGDRNFFEIQGSSVLVQSENQFISAQGKHLPTGISEPVNRLFAQNFTTNYNELAERDPVFADMRNIFDMALVAALCRVEGLHDKADWDLGAFAPEGAYQPAKVYAPKEVESVINHRVYGGKDIVVQVAGGVQADVVAIVKDKALAKSDEGVKDVARRGKLPKLPEGRWWWDAGK